MSKKLARIRALLESDPNNAFGWYSLAMEERKTDEGAALATFARVRRDFPEYLPNYYHYAQAAAAGGDLEQARQLYRDGIELARKLGDTHTLSELQGALDLL